ncbi:MAG: M28 family peptidase [Bacteroidales bacterium]|nr:M28 family peptidase [Bacteroidales bacterium]
MTPATFKPATVRAAMPVAVMVTVAILLVIIVNLRLHQPPAVVPAEAPPEVFSAERAAMHLPHIASRPNPIGSIANREVFDYIRAQLVHLGYEPEIHAATLFTSHQSFQRFTWLNNLLLKIPGTRGDQTLLIMGHYDTVISAPGASDNGAAVVTMLEALRMLQHHPPMKNNLIFFFPDGEEVGLLGAQAFRELHPWAENIDLIINLEAMGTSGQSIMFETGNNNLNIIRQFAGTVPHPVGNSMTVEVYKRIGTATDYNVFRDDGYQGLNFAYIGNSFDYHTAGDNIENTDLRSVQHHGSHLAALLLHLGNESFEPDARQNAVYFNTIGYGFVHYPYGWVPVIAVIVALTALLLLIKGVRDKTISLRRLLFGIITFSIHLLIIYWTFDAVFELIKSGYPGSDFRLLQYNQLPLLFGFSLIAVAFSAAFFHMIHRGAKGWQLSYLFSWVILIIWAGGDQLVIKSLVVLVLAVWVSLAHRKPAHAIDYWSSAVIVWVLLMLVVSFILPGASYLFVWPLVFCLVPFGLSVMKKNPEPSGPLFLILFLLSAIPVLAWFPVIIKLFIEAMGPGLIPVTMLVAGLAMGLMTPFYYLITRVRPWLIPGVLFLSGLVLLIAKAGSFDYSERHRQQNHVIYATDANSGKAYWMGSRDAWTAQFLTDVPDTINLGTFYPYLDELTIAKESQYPLLPAPEVLLLSDSIDNGERRLTLNVRSHNDAALLNFFINPGAHTPEIQMPGLERRTMRPVRDTDWYMIQLLAPPAEGTSFSVFTRSDQEVHVHVLEVDYSGIPEFADYEKRPATMMSSGDRSMTGNRFTF